MFQEVPNLRSNVCCLLLLMESQFNSQASAFTWETAAAPLGNPEFMNRHVMLRGGDRPPPQR